MSLQLLDLQALGGVASLLTIGGLCLFIWKRMGYPSAPWFAAAFLVSALSLSTGLAMDLVHRETPPQFLTVVRFVVTSLFCVGLLQLAGLPTKIRHQLTGLTLGTLVAGYCAGQALDFDYIGYAAVIVAAQLEMMGLYLFLATKRPRQGYGFVCATLALFPASLLLFYYGGVPVAFARYQSPTIYVLVTLTAFTVRMLRERTEVLAALQAKEAAQALLESVNLRLDERVEARTKELEEVVRYQDSFNRSVAHDLRGPVGAIASYSKVLVELLDSGDAVAVKKGLPAIAKQAESIVRTVNALLRLARASDVQLALTTTVLEPVVRMALQDVTTSQAISADEVHVVVHPLPTVVADVDLLKQLYANLLSNALKFSRNRPAAQVDVGCETTTDNTFIFYVRDTGAGFDMSRAERLFEPFVRMHGRDYAGTGVGLSICKRIVARHAGVIWVESEPNKGTTVYFTLGHPEKPVAAVRQPWYTETMVPEPSNQDFQVSQPPSTHQ